MGTRRAGSVASWGIQYLGTDKQWKFERSDDTPRMIYQLQGPARYRIGRRSYLLAAGQALVCSGALAGQGNDPFVEVKIPRAVFREALNALDPNYEHGREPHVFLVTVGKRNSVALESILVKLMREQERELPGSALSIRAQLLELLVFLYRVRSGTLPHWQQYETLGALINHQRVQSAIHYACEHCHKSLTLQQLAQMAGVNRTTFCRLHRILTGKTPMKLILEARIERAKALLAHSSLPLSAVAEAVGFASPPSFYRAFRQSTGTTPLAYRRTSRNSGQGER